MKPSSDFHTTHKCLLPFEGKSIPANYTEREAASEGSINFPGESAHSGWRARMTFHRQDGRDGEWAVDKVDIRIEQ